MRLASTINSNSSALHFDYHIICYHTPYLCSYAIVPYCYDQNQFPFANIIGFLVDFRLYSTSNFLLRICNPVSTTHTSEYILSQLSPFFMQQQMVRSTRSTAYVHIDNLFSSGVTPGKISSSHAMVPLRNGSTFFHPPISMQGRYLVNLYLDY